MKLNFSHMILAIRGSVAVTLPLVVLLLGGCGTDKNAKDVYNKPSATFNGSDSVARLHIGDSIVVTLDGPPDMIPPHEEVIKEDGSITLPDIGHVKASGCTMGELQDAIHDKYVPGIYKRLTVTVKTGDRVFFVSGEVKGPGRQIYTGPITVTKAIASAGDFTEYASRGNVVLTRANGERFTIDCAEILDGKIPDPDVYPGDKIEVKRSRF